MPKPCSFCRFGQCVSQIEGTSAGMCKDCASGKVFDAVKKALGKEWFVKRAAPSPTTAVGTTPVELGLAGHVRRPVSAKKKVAAPRTAKRVAPPPRFQPPKENIRDYFIRIQAEHAERAAKQAEAKASKERAERCAHLTRLGYQVSGQ